MKKAVSLVVLVSMLSGCASLINGTRQNIGVSSTPNGVQVKSESGDSCITPCVLSLQRRISHTLSFKKEGFEDAGVTVTNSASGWLWGNLVLGGLIGLGIDFISGGAYKLEPTTVSPALAKK